MDQYTLSNANGMRVTILPYGATIQSIEVPDRHGQVNNVVLGFADPARYREEHPYLGAVVGRYANRIGGASFGLDGTAYSLPENDGPNSLHGGTTGFSHRDWTVLREPTDASPVIELGITSPDGDQGYPGTLEARVTYTVLEHNALRVDYTATTDKLTVVNLTNHAYFNLAGEGNGDVFDHVLQFNATAFTPVNEHLIPTGGYAPVEGTPFDFRNPKEIGQDIRDGSSEQLLLAHGYDHNFVLDRPDGDPTALVGACCVTHPATGRILEVSTTEPGVQFYTGHLLEGGFAGTSGRIYRPGDGICLETQHFPDSPNQPTFPSTELAPGEEFTSTTIYTFSVDA